MPERSSERGLIGRERENRLGRLGIRNERNFVVRRKTVEKRIRSGEMLGANQIDRRTCLQQHQNLCRGFDGREENNRLLDVVVEYAELLLRQCAYEFSMPIEHTHIDLYDLRGCLNARLRWLARFLGWRLNRKAAEKNYRMQNEKGNESSPPKIRLTEDTSQSRCRRNLSTSH